MVNLVGAFCMSKDGMVRSFTTLDRTVYDVPAVFSTSRLVFSSMTIAPSSSDLIVRRLYSSLSSFSPSMSAAVTFLPRRDLSVRFFYKRGFWLWLPYLELTWALVAEIISSSKTPSACKSSLLNDERMRVSPELSFARAFC